MPHLYALGQLKELRSPWMHTMWTLLVENGAVVSLVLAGTVAAATIAYFLLRNRNRAPEAT